MDNHLFNYNFQVFLEQKQLSARTIKEYLYYEKKFLTYVETNIDRDVVFAFLGKNNNKVARAFVKNYLEFKEIDNIKFPKITGTEEEGESIVKHITREEVNSIADGMQHTDNPMRNMLMVAISFQGALRMQELLSLSSNSFRFTKWHKDTREPLEVIVKGKRNKIRIVNCSPDLARKIKEYIHKLQEIETLEKEDLIFRISPSRWWQILGKVSKKSTEKNEKVNPHMLRHSFAMYAKDELGWTLQLISKYLGHKNIATTMIYARTTDKELKAKFKEGFD